jgi:hypothetical protein
MDTTTQPLAFDELNNYAKQQAIGKYGDPPDDWHEDIYFRAIEEGPARGFEIDNIQHSGFHSQGDGASWTGYVDLLDFLAYHNKPDAKDYANYIILAELLREGWCDSRVSINRSGFYYNHSGTMCTSGVNDTIHYAEDDSVMDGGILEGANVKELAKSIDTNYLFNELDEWVLSRAREYADGIYKQLKEEYEAYTSEEYFKDLCDINGWRFNINGTLIEE